jgi:hypothetical protein
MAIFQGGGIRKYWFLAAEYDERAAKCQDNIGEY